jgi:hypothetical protein
VQEDSSSSLADFQPHNNDDNSSANVSLQEKYKLHIHSDSSMIYGDESITLGLDSYPSKLDSGKSIETVSIGFFSKNELESPMEVDAPGSNQDHHHQ